MGATDNKKSYMKWYRDRNKERLKKYQNKYNILYYEKLRAEKMDCICGGHFIKRNKSIHEKGKKHIEFCKKNDLNYFEYVKVIKNDLEEKNENKNILEKNNIEDIYNSLYGETNNF